MKLGKVVAALSAYYKTFSHQGGRKSPADLIVGYPADQLGIRIANVDPVGLGRSTATCWLDVPPGVVAMKTGADRVAGILLLGGARVRASHGNEYRFDALVDHWEETLRDLFGCSDIGRSWATSSRDDRDEIVGLLANGDEFALNHAAVNARGLEEIFERMAERGVAVDYGNLASMLLPGLYEHVDVDSPEFKRLTQSADEAFEELAK